MIYKVIRTTLLYMSVSSYHTIAKKQTFKMELSTCHHVQKQKKQNPQPDVPPALQSSVSARCHLLGALIPFSSSSLHSVTCSFQVLLSLPPNNNHLLLCAVMFSQYWTIQSTTCLSLVLTGCWTLFKAQLLPHLILRGRSIVLSIL